MKKNTKKRNGAASQAPSAVPVKKGRLYRLKKDFRRDWQLHLLILPPVIYLLIFHYWPMYGAQIAFRDYRARDGITGSKWVGLKWFEKFLSDFQTGIFYWSFSWKCFHTASAALRGTTAARTSTSASRIALMVPKCFRSASCRLGPTPGMLSRADRTAAS